MRLTSEQQQLCEQYAHEHQRWAQAILRKMGIPLELVDYLSIANEAICIAASTFRLDRNTLFSTYAQEVIRNELLDAVRRAQRAKRNPLLERQLTADALIVYDDLSLVDAVEELKAACERLPDMCKQVMTCRYSEHMTIDEIAEALGVSTSTVDNRISEAMALLRRMLDCS